MRLMKEDPLVVEADRYDIAMQFFEIAQMESRSIKTVDGSFKRVIERDKVLSNLNAAISIVPTKSEFYGERAEVYEYFGEIDLASRDRQMEKKLKISSQIIPIENPSSPTYKYRLASQAFRDAREAECRKASDMMVAHLTQAIKLIPTETEFYEKRAKAYEALGRTDLADQDHKMTKKLLSKINVPQLAIRYFDIAMMEESQKNYTKMVAYLTGAIDLVPNLAKFYQKRAEAYTALGDNKSASQDFEKMRELRSKKQAPVGNTLESKNRRRKKRAPEGSHTGYSQPSSSSSRSSSSQSSSSSSSSSSSQSSSGSSLSGQHVRFHSQPSSMPRVNAQPPLPTPGSTSGPPASWPCP